MGPAPSTQGARRGLDPVLSPLGRTGVCTSWPHTAPGAATTPPGPPAPSAHSGPSAALWPLRAPVGAQSHGVVHQCRVRRGDVLWQHLTTPPPTCICSLLRSLMPPLPALCSHGLLPPARAFCPCLPGLEASRAAPSEHPTLTVSALSIWALFWFKTQAISAARHWQSPAGLAQLPAGSPLALAPASQGHAPGRVGFLTPPLLLSPPPWPGPPE